MPPKHPRAAATTPAEPRLPDKGVYLLNHGWQHATGTEPWSWFDPKLPWSRHTIDHAFDVVKGKK